MRHKPRLIKMSYHSYWQQRVTRTLASLTISNFDVVHLARIRRRAADGLYRLRTLDKDITLFKDYLSLLPIDALVDDRASSHASQLPATLS